MLADLLSSSALTTLFQVSMIDLVLAGDNAIVIGLAASGIPKEQRAKVIFIGISAAAFIRICLALVATQLLSLLGLMLSGGLLLLFVSWKMWRELRHITHLRMDAFEIREYTSTSESSAPQKSMRQAVWQIIVADFSMSLDNVLAVGGAAHDHPWVLVFGLALSIGLTAFAASWIARLLHSYHWVAYVGLAIIVYVALEMIWRGWQQIAPMAKGIPAFFGI
jgi:YjbE family integral membrane protein